MKPKATDQAAVFVELEGGKCCFIPDLLNLVTRLVFFLNKIRKQIQLCGTTDYKCESEGGL